MGGGVLFCYCLLLEKTEADRSQWKWMLCNLVQPQPPPSFLHPPSRPICCASLQDNHSHLVSSQSQVGLFFLEWGDFISQWPHGLSSFTLRNAYKNCILLASYYCFFFFFNISIISHPHFHYWGTTHSSPINVGLQQECWMADWWLWSLSCGALLSVKNSH